jgi:hypothetical protein
VGCVHEGSEERVGVKFLQEKLELNLIRFRVWEFAITVRSLEGAQGRGF